MTLAAYNDVDDDDNLPMFGKTRQDCHFPLLKAAFTANIQVLLPILYYACADFFVSVIFDEAEFIGPACLRTLIEGKYMLELAISKLVTKLPGELLEESEATACNSKDRCLKDGLPRVDGLDDFVGSLNLINLRGALLVRNCFGERCSKCRAKLEKLVDTQAEEIWRRFRAISDSLLDGTFFNKN